MKREIVNKYDIVDIYGITKYQAEKLIRRIKKELASEGFAYYENKRLGNVPHEAVRKHLGLN